MSLNGVPEKQPGFVPLNAREQGSRKELVSKDFLSEMGKVVQAQADQLGVKSGDNKENRFTSVGRPETTTESEGEKKKHSLKTRFMKAILKGDFRKAFSEINHKISVQDFIAWLHRVLPDVDVTFRTFEGMEYPVRLSGSEEVSEGEQFLVKVDDGAKILGQVDNFLVKGALYKCKHSLIKPIDDLIAGLKSGGPATREYS